MPHFLHFWVKHFCECGLYVADLEKARREHLKSAEHKSCVAASKQAGALGGFIKKRPALPTPKQIAEAELWWLGGWVGGWLVVRPPPPPPVGVGQFGVHRFSQSLGGWHGEGGRPGGAGSEGKRRGEWKREGERELSSAYVLLYEDLGHSPSERSPSARDKCCPSLFLVWCLWPHHVGSSLCTVRVCLLHLLASLCRSIWRWAPRSVAPIRLVNHVQPRHMRYAPSRRPSLSMRLCTWPPARLWSGGEGEGSADVWCGDGEGCDVFEGERKFVYLKWPLNFGSRFKISFSPRVKFFWFG